MAQTAEKIEVLRDSAALRGVDDGGANARIMAEIARLGLERNVRELDEVGYTLLMPEQVGRAGFADSVLSTILDIAERETGARPSIEGGDSFGEQIAPLGRGTHFPEILFADPIFEQVVMTEAPLALITYLLGESCELAAMNAVIKAAGDEYLALHVDTPQPSPLPPYSQVANATWILTDYDTEKGATVMVPGSHTLCRHPVGEGRGVLAGHGRDIGFRARHFDRGGRGAVHPRNGNQVSAFVHHGERRYPVHLDRFFHRPLQYFACVFQGEVCAHCAWPLIKMTVNGG